MYKLRIKHLEAAHNSLDQRIRSLETSGIFEDMQLHAMKKQKLKIKDDIQQLKNRNKTTVPNKT